MISNARVTAQLDAVASLQDRHAAAPPAPEILSVDREYRSVDREYRSKAARGELPLITPRRFNPRQEAWLPVLHTSRAGRQYTALFSNTARAHGLKRTRDWVVICVHGDRGERQYTVVTARLGPKKGKRVVRGREVECLRWLADRRWRAQRARPLHLAAHHLTGNHDRAEGA